MVFKLEYKIFSKVHPDYFFLVVKSGDKLLIDTNLLQKTLTTKDKKTIQNHESVEELLFKLKDRVLIIILINNGYLYFYLMQIG